MTKIDPTRPVQTRSGRPARIVCTDCKNESNPLVVLVSYRTGNELVYTYRADGKFSGSGERLSEDLINVSLSSEEYVKKSGAVCPACGSNKAFYRQDSALGSLTRSVACHDCNATWTETLAITGYLDLKVEEDGE
jgi:DNA-directed RNA polymerase subunit M/transcription elongation factor TFIIS